MARVEIEYCGPCGFLGRAEEIQHALLSTFGEQLESVTLTTGDNGIFVVRVDDESVFDKHEGTVNIDAIVRRVRDRL